MNRILALYAFAAAILLSLRAPAAASTPISGLRLVGNANGGGNAITNVTIRLPDGTVISNADCIVNLSTVNDLVVAAQAAASGIATQQAAAAQAAASGVATQLAAEAAIVGTNAYTEATNALQHAINSYIAATNAAQQATDLTGAMGTVSAQVSSNTPLPGTNFSLTTTSTGTIINVAFPESGLTEGAVLSAVAPVYQPPLRTLKSSAANQWLRLMALGSWSSGIFDYALVNPFSSSADGIDLTLSTGETYDSDKKCYFNDNIYGQAIAWPSEVAFMTGSVVNAEIFSNSWTASVWIKPTDTTGESSGFIFRILAADSFPWGVQGWFARLLGTTVATNSLKMEMRDGDGSGGMMAPTPLSLNEWSHIVCTWTNDGTMDMWVNGVEIGPVTGCSLVRGPYIAIDLRWSDSVNEFYGDMDDFVLYSGLKDGTWVTNAYNAGAGWVPTNEVTALYRFDWEGNYDDDSGGGASVGMGTYWGEAEIPPDPMPGFATGLLGGNQVALHLVSSNAVLPYIPTNVTMYVSTTLAQAKLEAKVSNDGGSTWRTLIMEPAGVSVSNLTMYVGSTNFVLAESNIEYEVNTTDTTAGEVYGTVLLFY